MAKYILSDIFQGDFPITQYFGNNPDYYRQFGFAGHEGVDFGTPVGTPILAPFDGKILQDIDDLKSGAYGDYIVCWDPNQKCALWYCHLSSNIVSYGEYVHKGQILGYTGNSGNSTGPHLHVNFVETDINGSRLDMNNGYKGMKNILDPELVDWQLNTDDTIPTPVEEVITDQTHIPQIDNKEVQAIRSELNDLKNTIQQKDDRIQYLDGEIDRLASGYKIQNDKINSLQQSLDDCREISSHSPNLAPTAVSNLTFGQLFNELLKRLKLA